MRNALRTLIVFVLLGAASAPAAHACAVCMGADDSSVAPAANGAIFFMIGVIGFILTSIVGFICYLAWRAKHPAVISPELAAAVAIISEEQHA